MKTKHFQSKADTLTEDGEVSFVFSTFNIIDRDKDVVLPSAIKDGKSIPMVWAHDWDMPIGKGTITNDGSKAIFTGKFFLDTDWGKNAYNTVKNMGDLQQYSWGFRVVNQEKGEKDGQAVNFIKETEEFEVSPVLIGANQQTYTVDIKGNKKIKSAIRSHSTATTDEAWDGPQMKKNLPNEESALKAAFAWVDSEGDPDVKSSYKFIHHMVSSDGEVGAANETACSIGIGVLNGGRAGTTIPDSDRKGVYNHLAKHLRDAGKEPPELKELGDIETKMMAECDVPGSYESLRDELNDAFRVQQFSDSSVYGYTWVVATFSDHFIASIWTWDQEEDTYWDVQYGRDTNGNIVLGSMTQVEPETSFVPVVTSTGNTLMSYAQHSDFVVSAISEYLRRCKSVSDSRRKQGRAISGARMERMSTVMDYLQSAMDEMQSMMDEVSTTNDNEGKSLYVEFLRIESKLLGVI